MERPAGKDQSAKIFAEFLFPWKFVHTKWSWRANCVKSVTYIRKEYKYQAVQNLPVLCYLVQHNFHTDNNTDKKKDLEWKISPPSRNMLSLMGTIVVEMHYSFIANMISLDRQMHKMKSSI